MERNENTSIIYSFIIPHKNSPSLLKRCLDSIPLREDVEVIVVDDNSNPEKKPVLERKDTRLVLLDASQSKGAGRARNAGLAKAKGKWVLFADADDYFADKLFDTLDKYKDTDADVIYYSYLNVGNDNSYSVPGYHKSIISAPNNQECRDKVRYLHNAPWNKMVRKDLIDSKKIRFEETINGNDVFYSLKVGWYSRKSIFIDTPLYYYVFSPYGITNNKSINEDAILCQMTHLHQSNAFKTFIGYPQWRVSMPRYMLAKWRMKGFGSFIKVLSLYLSNYKKINKDKNKFVDFFRDFE